MKGAFSGENGKIQQAHDIITACADVTDTDRCEASSKIFTCAGIFSESKGHKTINWSAWTTLFENFLKFNNYRSINVVSDTFKK